MHDTIRLSLCTLQARPNATKLLRHAWMTGDSTQGGVKKALPMPPPPQPVPGASGAWAGGGVWMRLRVLV